VSQRRLVRVMTVAAVALFSTLLIGTAATAAQVDSTPPTAPFLGYTSGFQCTMR
jgi:hypothetical protein